MWCKTGNIASFAGAQYLYHDTAHVHAVTHVDETQRYWYDANGNMITRIECTGEPPCSPVTYQQRFDIENRLTVVTNTTSGEVTQFVYDGDGTRVAQWTGDGLTVYVGDLYERFFPYSAIGEVGQISALTHVTQTVMLSHAYVNPVVFAQPLPYPLQPPPYDAAVVRITNVQTNSFSLRVQEATNANGSSPALVVSYLVLEAGTWQLPDGRLLQVGRSTTSRTVGRRVLWPQWLQVTFSTQFTSTPAVLAQVQTSNDASWVKTRQRDASATRFYVALEEEENSTGQHGTEVIGWLAITAGQGDWSGRLFQAAQTGNSVTDTWYSISFGRTYQTPGAFQFRGNWAADCSRPIPARR